MVNVCICDDDIRVVNKIVNLLNENFIDDKLIFIHLMMEKINKFFND